MAKRELTESAGRVALSKIKSVLHEHFLRIDTQEGVFSKACGSNIIAVISSPDEYERLSSVLTAVSYRFPSRFFSVVIDSRLSEIVADVSVVCFQQDSGDHTCSEVIKLSTPAEHFGAIPSVVYGNSAPGDRTILCLLDRYANRRAFEAFADIADEIIIDSASFASGFELLPDLNAAGVRIIDLNWFRVSVWRDQIKLLFEGEVFRELLERLTAIEVIGGNQVVGSSAYSIAGWLIDRLSLEVRAFGASGYDCETLDGRMVKVSIKPGSDVGLQSITFKAESEADDELYIKLVKNELLDTFSNIKSGFHVTRRIESEREGDLLVRYFSVGESLTNYPRALSIALDLKSLKDGFG